MPESILKLETPALILDAGRLQRNLARMREKLERHGVALRPHVKTAKSIEVVRRALIGQAGGITARGAEQACVVS